jgi:hypothetical protein
MARAIVRLAGAAMLATTIAAAGCGGPGYRVLRSDSRVEYPEGPIGFDAGAVSAAELARSLREGLATSSTRYEIVEASGEGSPPYTIRLLSLDRDGESGRLTARVAIVDAQGAATSELELESQVAASDADANRAASQLGERIAHYLATRSQHHY